MKTMLKTLTNKQLIKRRAELILLSLLFISCNKTYDLQACNDLSMKQFKGFTDAKKKFADHCTDFDVKYTQEVCQAALNELILKNDLDLIKEKYGDPIVTCFNEQDIKKYHHRE